MERTKLGFFSLLIPCILAGCTHFQTSGQMQPSPPLTGPTNTIQGEVKSPEKILFEGQNMTVIESVHGDIMQIPFDRGKTSCVDNADENFKGKLRMLGYKGDTKRYEFDAKQTYNFGPDKFSLKMSKDLFSRIDPSFLKKLDRYVGFTITRNLYLISNGDSSYLLLIGPESATSGMGHNYRTHLLVPLDANRPTINFQSISDDPRRIGIIDSATIYYTQVDPPYHGAIKQTVSKTLRLAGSLFTVDNARNKKLESKVDFDCKTLEDIFQE